MQEIAGSVLGDEVAGGGDAGAAVPGPTPTIEEVIDDLTPDKVRALIDESLNAREAKAAEEAAIDGIFAEVRAAGFDPQTAEGFMVLYNANHYTDGDIGKAVELTQQYRQSIIDDYVAGRSGGRPAPSPAGGVVATPTAGPITSIEDARSATERFLRERRTAQ
jgi:hypothetical protein